MQEKVIVRERQRSLYSDLMDLQSSVQNSLDKVVRYGIGPGSYYVGLQATKTGTWEVTLAPGDITLDGAMYRQATSKVFSDAIFNLRPVSQKKIVAVVAFGQDVETTPSGAPAEPRQFMVNTTTRETEVQLVSTRAVRFANISLVPGAEQPAPVVPVPGAGNVLIATVLLNATGIEAVAMNEAAVMPQAYRNAVALAEQTTILSAFGARLTTFASDLAAISSRFSGLAREGDLATLRKQLLDTTALAGRALDMAKALDTGGGYLYDFEDYYVDDRFTDLAGAGYAAKVGPGITFPDGASTTLTNGIELFTANDPKVMTANGQMLPAYTHRCRIDTFGVGKVARQAELQSYTSATHTITTTSPAKQTMSYSGDGRGYKEEVTLTYPNTPEDIVKFTTLFGIVWGNVGNGVEQEVSLIPYVVDYWGKKINGQYERITRVAGKVIHSLASIGGVSMRRTIITWSVGYTVMIGKVVSEIPGTTTTAPATIDGQGRAEGWLQERDGWLTRVGLFVATKGGSGDIKLVVCETNPDGSPNMAASVAHVTVPYASILASPITTASPAGIETVVDIPPALCLGGRRYAVAVLSPGAHVLRMTEDVSNLTQGEHWALSDANKWERPLLDTRQTLAMRLYFAAFAATRIAVDLKPLSLAGGILDVQIAAQMIVPPICRLDFEAQPDGTNWRVLGQGSGQRIPADLSGNPELMPFRVVFVGSEDIMPALSVGASRSTVKLARPASAMLHWSEVINAGAAANKIRVETILNGFVEATHDHTIQLVTDPGGTPTTESADSTFDTVLSDGRIRRTCIFDLPAGKTTFKVKQVGARSTAALYAVEHLRASFFDI